MCLIVILQGTSADQDTRFSNKHAKLMKSQKFAAELENLVSNDLFHVYLARSCARIESGAVVVAF